MTVQEHMSIVLESMIEAVLGKKYYNMSLDSWSCREECAYDILYHFNPRIAKKYERILNNKMRKYKEKNENDNNINKIIEEMKG
jgi:hypothetical protein